MKKCIYSYILESVERINKSHLEWARKQAADSRWFLDCSQVGNLDFGKISANSTQWAMLNLHCVYCWICSTVHVFPFFSIICTKCCKMRYSSCVSLATEHKKWQIILNSGHLTDWKQLRFLSSILLRRTPRITPLFLYRLPCIPPSLHQHGALIINLYLPSGHAS
jgi:hypothetical protein